MSGAKGKGPARLPLGPKRLAIHEEGRTTLSLTGGNQIFTAGGSHGLGPVLRISVDETATLRTLCDSAQDSNADARASAVATLHTRSDTAVVAETSTFRVAMLIAPIDDSSIVATPIFKASNRIFALALTMDDNIL
jgi:hypothetical protein